MPRSPNRLLTAARWPLGILITGWSYMWRTTPMHRRELHGSWEDDAPPPFGGAVERDAVQGPGDGAGPLLHRRYAAPIAESGWDARRLIAHVSADPNRVTPGGLAHFQKVEGDEGRLAVGDEFVVRMPGPWDGPVRVVEVTPTSFRLATLDGHLEAGQIEWSASDEDGCLLFTVQSWARSGDKLSDVMHNRLRMAKEVQLHMWTSVLERVVELVDGRLPHGIDIETRRVESHELPAGAR